MPPGERENQRGLFCIRVFSTAAILAVLQPAALFVFTWSWVGPHSQGQRCLDVHGRPLVFR